MQIAGDMSSSVFAADQVAISLLVNEFVARHPTPRQLINDHGRIGRAHFERLAGR
jgi:hypothetical protein